MKTILICVGVLYQTVLLGNTAFQSEYILTIDKENPYKVRVNVRFDKKVDTLSMHPACQNYDYPEGWSTFIDPQSKNLTYLGKTHWKVGNKKEITYEVDLSFVREKWEVGNEQAGKYMNNSMFVVTRALFLTSANQRKSKVTFNLPSEYTVVAPWTSLGEHSFIVDSKEALYNNTIVWGMVNGSKISVKNFNLQFVLLGYTPEVSHLIRKTFEAILREYLEMFPQTPQKNYLITVFPFEQNDGEAYATSNAFTLKIEPSSKNKVIWANQFAHELFHFWNGRMINGPERSKRQWFSEGFTEYFANLALVRSEAITQTEFYRLIEKTIGLYFYYKNRQYPNVSLVAAGSKKSKYRFGVYNGGWCSAFVLDMLIREKTADKTLGDFMNVLFKKYGLDNQSYVFEDLEKELSLFLGTEEVSFFRKYIAGNEVLPLETYFKRMGMGLDYTSYEGTAFLFNIETANILEIQLREAWLTQ